MCRAELSSSEELVGEDEDIWGPHTGPSELESGDLAVPEREQTLPSGPELGEVRSWLAVRGCTVLLHTLGWLLSLPRMTCSQLLAASVSRQRHSLSASLNLSPA